MDQVSDSYRVTANRLNVRSRPVVVPETRLAALDCGHLVRKLDESPDGGWWRIKTTLQGRQLTGFVAQRFLAPTETTPPGTSHIRPPAVHLTENRTDITRHRDGGRAFPIGEADRPGGHGGSPAEKCAAIHRIVRWLDVERGRRYLPKDGTTYCNIYAYDVCYLSGVYLPRVWWTPGALLDLNRGKSVACAYGSTVREMNANALHDWLEDHGTGFGWVRRFDLNALQEAVNEGDVGVICAQRKDLNRPGHISVVVPETKDHLACRRGGEVLRPLQSQAGSRNARYATGTYSWWLGEQFDKFGFWTAA